MIEKEIKKPSGIKEKNCHSNYVLFGITRDFIDKLDYGEKNQLNTWIAQADESLSKIIDLKYDKMKVTHAQYRKMSDKEYQKLCKIGFYYSAVKNMDLEINNIKS